MIPMKGAPSALVLPFNLFFELKEEFYSKLSGKEAYLVSSPFVVKAYCSSTEPTMISVPPGSLVTYEEDALDLGACVAGEYFWFEGWELSWEVKTLPEWLEELAQRAGFAKGSGRSVLPLEGIEGEAWLKRPWHPAARGLEEGLRCEGGKAEGLVIAGCGNASLIIDADDRIYLGKVEEPWRLLPAIAYASRR